MIKLHNGPVQIRDGVPIPCLANEKQGREDTIAYRIFRSHDLSTATDKLAIRFDSLISHDITYVGIIQTASASGLERFPVPYVLTNCHNSLCAVGGTINADDHAFGLSAAKKYGGIYVPANMAVIHQYAREELSGCGRMVLGSDSHTRYGALGTMGVGEGGPELVKQLLGDRWESPAPEVVLVWLTGTPRQGVGPHDVAIALCGAVYKNNFVKNKVLEFAGPGVAGLSMDYRIGIDVMTTETACLTSIWQTDSRVEEYFAIHARPEAYRELKVKDGARYDAMVEIDLSRVEPMAALPFHPSEAVTIRELRQNAGDILRQVELRVAEQYGGKVQMHLTDKLVNGQLMVEQGVIAGCAGGMYDNLAEAAAILQGHDVGCGNFELTVYPPSIPVQLEMMRNGVSESLTESGALLKTCFCGPCFGAGDVPANNALSIRHTTRNFPNREGSKPGDGQLSAVLLMDARSIAATARNHGVLTAATDVDYKLPDPAVRVYDRTPYERRVYSGFGKAETAAPLQFGPNIVPWPQIPALSKHLLLRLASVLHDAVTTTDELIPSGETSSYRSNPLKLASFALSRRDPAYVGRAQATEALEKRRLADDWDTSLTAVLDVCGVDASVLADTHIGSAIFAEKPGDGSAREQAASCQRVLGGSANICREFATKRYRSNCINWGMLPFTIAPETAFDYAPDDWIFIPDIRHAVECGADRVPAQVIHKGKTYAIELLLPGFTAEEREIVLAGCLMNWYAARKKEEQ
ncbi:MAG: hydratase [Oscillospiraceae bacterium]|nr:hydratase [Oscillospiraceae bacterium]